MVKKNLLVLAALSIISTLLSIQILLHPGPILYWDFALPIYPKNFALYHYPLWNELTSSSNIESISRLGARLPFILMAFLNVPVDIIEKVMFWFLNFLGVSSAYIFLRFVFYLPRFAALSITPIYAITIPFTDYFFQYSTPWGGMVFPAVFTLVYLGLTKKKLAYLAAATIILITTAQHPFGFLVSCGFLAILWFLFFLFDFAEIPKNWTWHLKNGIIFGTLLLLLSAYYLLPVIIIRPSSASLGHYIPNTNDVSDFSPDTPIQPLLMYRSVLTDSQYWYANSFLQSLQFVAGILQFIILIPFAVIVLIKNRIILKTGQRIISISIPLLFIIVWGFSLGTNGPFSLIINAALKFSFGSIFRSPYKWYLFFPFFSLAGLGIITSFLIWKFSDRFVVLALAVILGLQIFYNLPAFLGSQRSLTSAVVPKAFDAANHFLLEKYAESGSFKVLWFPPYVQKSTSWAPESRILPFDIRSSQVPTYNYFWTSPYSNFVFSSYLPGLFKRNADQEIASLFQHLAIKYIVLHVDRIGTAYAAEDAHYLRQLRNSPKFQLVFQDDFLYIFEVKGFVRSAAVVSHTPILLSDFGVMTSALFANQDLNTAFVPGDITLAQENWDKTIEITNGNENLLIDEIISSQSKNIKLIKPYNAVEARAIDKKWSVASGFDLQGGEWHSVLEASGIDNWDLDYGVGLAMTRATKTQLTLDLPMKNINPGKYVILVRAFHSILGADTGFYLDDQKLDSRSTYSPVSSFKWIKFDIVVDKAGDHIFKVIHHNGLSAINQLAIIPMDQFDGYVLNARQKLAKRQMFTAMEVERDCSVSGQVRQSLGDLPKSNGYDRSLIPSEHLMCSFDTYSGDSYTVVIRGSGKYLIKIGSETQTLNLSKYNFHTVGEYALKDGINSLELVAEEVTAQDGIDVVWIFPSSLGDDLSSAFSSVTTTPSAALDITHPKSTVYQFQGATPNALVTLYESFDSGWVMKIDGKKVEPIPVFGVINGYMMPLAASASGVVEFLPQNSLDIGVIISLITMACLVVYFIRFARW